MIKYVYKATQYATHTQTHQNCNNTTRQPNKHGTQTKHKKHNNTAHLESEQTSTKHESHIMYRCSNANHEPHTKTSNTIATKRNNNNEDKANAKHEKSDTRISNTKKT